MNLVGKGILRAEDATLLAGQGRFADDLRLEGACFVVFARAHHAHARIAALETAAARAAEGVLAVLTGADLDAAGIGPIPHNIGSSKAGADVALANRDGSERARTPHKPLPTDRVRFAGEAYAAVVAETAAAARDAAELIAAEWEPLAAVVDARAALAPGAPRLWAQVPGNLALEAEIGDRAATDAAFEGATHVVRLDARVNRVTGVHMEPRSAAALFDAEAGQYVLRASGGAGVVQIRDQLAAALGVDPALVRVRAPEEVGGNFGTRNATYPEWVVMAHAARITGRPVKHVVDRLEAFSSDFQGRDQHVAAELALDAQGNFLAFRSTNTADLGAYTVSYVALNKAAQQMTGLYRVPQASVVARAVLTNTPPTIPYRSAGRPEAMFAIERLIDLAARDCGFDRIALRRRNMIPDDAFPHTNPFGVTCDNGAHRDVMAQLLEMADHAGFAARRAEARARGRWRGFGMANYLEATSGNPRERAEIAVRPETGVVEVVLGTQDSGQGHRTAFAQLVAAWFGIAVDQVVLRTGDTAFVTAGGGSHSGRSLRFGSIVMDKAARDVIARGRAVFAALNGAEPGEVTFEEGYFRLPGGNVVMHLFELARAAQDDTRLPAELCGGLAAFSDAVTPGFAFPYGSAACELEIDPETGAVEIIGYWSVDDVGRALNPLIVHGQTHGGIAQGVGQALFEDCVFDPATAQNLTASFMDYRLPRAADLPMFGADISEVPATSHPLGFRPGGEGGTTPALAVCGNAVADALADLGVRHVEMPATPLRIWEAIATARKTPDGP